MMPFKSTLIALLIASSLLFSGCLGFLEDDDEVGPEDDSEMDHSNMDHGDMDHDMDNETEEDDPSDNETVAPPEASLAANVTEGAAPLAVSFTLEAEHDDPEGLSWSLDIGDDVGAESGDELPATVDHVFDAAGNFTVVLNVSHGEANDEAEVTITVTEVDSPEPADEQTGSGADCLDFNVFWAVEGTESPLAQTVDVLVGTVYRISSDLGTANVDFYDDDGVFLGTSEGEEGEGVVPAEATFGIMCVGATGTFPDVPVPAGAWSYQDGFEPAE